MRTVGTPKHATALLTLTPHRESIGFNAFKNRFVQKKFRCDAVTFRKLSVEAG